MATPLTSARRGRSARANAGIVAGVWLLFALVGFALGPGPADAGGAHVLGVDGEGRDVLRRLLAGIFPTLGFALLVSTLVTLAGGFVGAAAGFGARVFDLVFSRLAEGLSAFPTFLAVLVVEGLIGKANVFTLGLAILLTRVPDAARFVRAEAQRLRVSQFISASQALGASRLDLLRRQFPAFAVPLAFATLRVTFVPCVYSETIATLLGVGLEGRRTWGAILRDTLLGKAPIGPLVGVTIILALFVFSMRAFEGIEDKLTARAS